METAIHWFFIVSICSVVILAGILALDALFVTDLDKDAGISRGQDMDKQDERYCPHCGHELE